MVLKMSETNVKSNLNNNNNMKKRFDLLSKESIKLIVDQNGVEDMTEEAVLMLSSDVSYRLREVIHSAIEFMSHSKRRRLSTSDINRALEWSDCEQVFGFEANEIPIHNHFVSDANVFVSDDTIIDLNEELNEIFDKKSCDLKVFEKDIQMTVEWLSHNDSQTSNEDNCLELNERLEDYYKHITNAILGTNSHSFALVLQDLSTNCEISPVLPFLINFIMNGIKRQSHDISQLKRFLHSIQSLFRNPSLFLATNPYLNVLIQSILYCIVEPLDPIVDHWTLRDSASHLLVSVLNEWFPPFVANLPKEQTLKCLCNCLSDNCKPFRCHYGVVKAFQSLGFDIIVEHLYPILNQYFTHILSVIDGDHFSTDPSVRTEGHRVFSELLLVSELISLKMRSNLLNNIKTNLDVNFYHKLSDIFGDSLSARLPIDFEKIKNDFYCEKYKNWTKREIRLFETPESLQTGEELLDAFYETPTHMEELRSEMSANLEDDISCDDNYFLSDNEKEAMASDVMIKSSVSDPTLGVKLTFKKLRRDPKESKARDKRCVTTKILNLESVFDIIPLKQTEIRFNISGSGLECNALFDKPVDRPDYCRSEWFVLTMTNLNKFAIRTNSKKIVKNDRKLCLYSCDLLNVL